MSFGRNEAKELLTTQELAFSGTQDELLFQGKKHPPKPITRRKIHHLWGISLSARPPMSTYILDGSSASRCGLGARSLQLFSKCPPSQQRTKSGVRLASRMLQNWLRGSKYSKTRGPKRQNYAGPHFYGAPMASGAAVAVTLPPADQGDSETVKETLAKAGEEVAAEANRSGQPLEAVPVTAPGEARAQLRTPVETGGIQRARLRRHPNILKRLLVHLLPLDLGLVIRKVPGRGTPRGLQGSPVDLAVIHWGLRKEAWALKLASITCPRRSDGLHAFPRLQCSLPRQLPKSLFLLPPDRRCNPAWVEVVWLHAMSPRQTDSSRVFSDSRHLKLPTPWPIWFCGQKSSSARLTEFRSDFYLFLQYSHSFSFGVTGKAKKDT